MGILSDRNRHRQQRCSTKSTSEYINGDNNSWFNRREHHNRNGNKFLRQLRLLGGEQLHSTRTRSSLSIFPIISRSRDDQPDDHTKSHHHKKRDRHNKYLYPIVLCLTQLATAPAILAEGVGGVSATANPIANSSGSVTNQAIQVLQGPYVTNTYGGGVSCQGSTLNVTPYVQFADSRKDPWEDFYNEPQYNMTDVSGRTTKQTVTVKNYPWESWYDDRTKADGTRWFPDGEDIQIEIDVDGPDGVPDVVSGGSMDPTWYKPVRTDMRANQSLNVGLSATLSIPMNRKLQKQCIQAADAQIAHQTQLTSNKRLDFELARLKNCGELKKAGIFFHPASPYHAVCADVVVTNPGGKIVPHVHNLPQPNFSSEESSSEVSSSDSSSVEVVPSSSDTHQQEPQNEKDGTLSFLGWRLPFQSPSSQQVSPPSAADQLGVWQVGQTTQPLTQSPPSSSQSED